MEETEPLFPLTDELDGISVNQQVIFVNDVYDCYGRLGRVVEIDGDPNMPYPYLVETPRTEYKTLYVERCDIDPLEASQETGMVIHPFYPDQLVVIFVSVFITNTAINAIKFYMRRRERKMRELRTQRTIDRILSDGFQYCMKWNKRRKTNAMRDEARYTRIPESERLARTMAQFEKQDKESNMLLEKRKNERKEEKAQCLQDKTAGYTRWEGVLYM